MKLDHIDHVVFTVRDIATTCDFYARVLGMEVVRFEERTALHFGGCKINFHQAGSEFEPKAVMPAPGTQDICLITPWSIQRVVAHLNALDVAIIEGPVPQRGAQGQIESVYLRDPDGNLVEIATYLVTDSGE